jgi:peptidoglycan/xylan/chitin deacetylase (PgdA/CDA1 family)
MIPVLAFALLMAQPALKPGLPPRTFCLTYHDVVAERTADSLWFDCAEPELKQQLDWMGSHGAHFVSLDQLYAHLTSGARLPSHPVCITFADNYLGFYTYAYPILKTRHIPCAMFVHTGYVGSPIGRPKMDWDQLRQLDREGLVTVASQTVSHPLDLRKLSWSKQLAEMVDSKGTLEQQLGHPVPYVAYPNGKYDVRVEEAARRAGYRMAFTEVLTPAEESANIFAVDRYVHTKWRRAWRDANR